MNKLYVVNEKIEKKELDGTLEVQNSEQDDFFSVSHIEITALEDTELMIIYHTDEKIKLNVAIKTNPNVNLKLYEIRTGIKPKVQYKYKLEEYSNIEVVKFYDMDKMRELDIVELNGRGAKFNMVLKTIASDHEKYDMLIYHNAKDTSSTIINQGISIFDGEITFNITGVIPSGKTGCTCHEKNRIINLNDSKNKISPNLLVDEYDVEADHGAYIGKFEDDEIFYLQSRGIPYDETIRLLTEGFLNSYIEEEQMLETIRKSLKKYWG